jgi:tetratricopeptide (TPR) repeat protein
MAELDIQEGRPAAARDLLLPLLDRLGLHECEVTRFLPVLAWAHLELGEIEQAAAVVQQALARARPEQMRLVLVEALRVGAMVAIAQGYLDDAAQSLEEGLDLARSMPYPYAETRLLQLQTVLDAEMGEPEAAGARLP